MTSNNVQYNLPLVNHNIYWPIIGYLHCMTSFFIRHYKLLLILVKMKAFFLDCRLIINTNVKQIKSIKAKKSVKNEKSTKTVDDTIKESDANVTDAKDKDPKESQVNR